MRTPGGCWQPTEPAGSSPPGGSSAPETQQVGPKGAGLLRVYIAGPLSSPECTCYLQNVHRFYAADRELRACGFAPFNPAADFISGVLAGDMEYEDYFRPNLAWMEVADAVLLLGRSPGADRECERARELHIPVHTSVIALMAWWNGQQRVGNVGGER